MELLTVIKYLAARRCATQPINYQCKFFMCVVYS